MTNTLATQHDYAARQREIRAALTITRRASTDEPTSTDKATARYAAAASTPCDLDDLAAAAALVIDQPMRRSALDASETRQVAVCYLPELLAAGHPVTDAAKVALYRANMEGLTALQRRRDEAAGISGDMDSADPLAFHLTAADAGAEWVQATRIPRPDALRLVADLSPEDAHALGVDSLPPLFRRVIVATIDANEGADVTALSHTKACKKQAGKPSACCRKKAIAPGLKTAAVTRTITGKKDNGATRGQTKKDQQESGRAYLHHVSAAHESRTAADAEAWTEHAEQVRDARTLLPHRAPWAGPQSATQAAPAPRTALCYSPTGQPLPWAAVGWTPTDEHGQPVARTDAFEPVSLNMHRQQVASVANGTDRPARQTTRVSDLPEWAVMPDQAASDAVVMPDPDTLTGQTRTGQTIGYDLAVGEQHQANRDSGKERAGMEMARGNDSHTTGLGQPSEMDRPYGYGRPEKVTAEEGAEKAYAHKTHQPDAEKVTSAGGAGVAPTLATVSPSAESRWADALDAFERQAPRSLAS